MAKGISFKNMGSPAPEIATYTISETDDVRGVWHDGFGYVVTAGDFVRYYVLDHASTSMKLVNQVDLSSSISDLVRLGGIVGTGTNYFINYVRFNLIATSPPTGSNQYEVAMLGPQFEYITNFRNLNVTTGPSTVQNCDITYTGTHLIATRDKGFASGNPDHTVEVINVKDMQIVSSTNINRDLRGTAWWNSRLISTNTNGSIAQLDVLPNHTVIVPNAGGSLSTARGCCMLMDPMFGEDWSYGDELLVSPTVAIIHNA